MDRFSAWVTRWGFRYSVHDGKRPRRVLVSGTYCTSFRDEDTARQSASSMTEAWGRAGDVCKTEVFSYQAPRIWR